MASEPVSVPGIPPHGRFANLLISAAFIGMLCLPVAFAVSGGSGNGENTEKRKLASFPTLNPDNLAGYTKSIDAWYSDNFRGRTLLIRMYSVLKYRLFKVSPKPDLVLAGKNKCFFKVKDNLDNYRRINPPAVHELKAAYEALMDVYNFCTARHIKYYLVICPDPVNIYTENLPSNVLQPAGVPGRKEAFLKYLEEKKCPVTIIDLYDYIKSKKVSGGSRLYHNSDSHWNGLGSFYGYEKMMQVIVRDFPQIKPLTLNDYTVDSTSTRSGDLLLLSSLYNQTDLFDNNIIMKPRFTEQWRKLPDVTYLHDAVNKNLVAEGTNIPGNTGVKACFFHDSFGHHILPELSNTFSPLWSSFVSHARTSNKTIAEQNPDLVIDLVVDRSLIIGRDKFNW